MILSRPRRILLHPGFHKTGTSSIQHFLWSNRAALAPHVALLLLRDLKPVAKLCQGWSRSGNPLFLVDLAGDLTEALATLPADGDIVISCEALSGHLPGWPGVGSYGAATASIAAVVTVLAEAHDGAEIMVALSTRDPEGWLSSVWRHHLMGQRLREDEATFRARIGPAGDLSAALREVAEAVAPVPVFDLPLDLAATHPLGPGGFLLELLELPAPVTAALRPVPTANRGPDAALAGALLALNRSDLRDAEFREAKAALLAEAGVGGWVRP